jgi:squalene cyclase
MILLEQLQNYVQEVGNFLNSKITHNQKNNLPIAGWHNYFKPGRIGTTGSAVPLIFFHNTKITFPFRAEVLNFLLSSQCASGAWSILSLAELPSVEGTAWPLKALHLAGNNDTRISLYKAEDWLISQQNEDGGWGSNKLNKPRTLLTCVVVESLTSLSSPAIVTINKALNWLTQSQRRDGSWGMELGNEGTVYHTCKVLNTLLQAGLSTNDPRIQKGMSFLKERWSTKSK